MASKETFELSIPEGAAQTTSLFSNPNNGSGHLVNLISKDQLVIAGRCILTGDPHDSDASDE